MFIHLIPCLSVATNGTSIFTISTLLLLTLLHAIQRWRKHRHLPPSPTTIPLIGHLHLLGPLIHQSLHNLSQRYGPLFSLRLGSVPCVIVSSPTIAKEFLKTNELAFLTRIDSIAIKGLTYDGSAYAFAPYGPYWKFINKLLMTKLLSPRALTQFLPIQKGELQHLLKVLAYGSKAGSSVNVTKELVKLTNNVISHMMLGIRRSDSAEGQANEARVLVREVTKIFGEFNVSDFIWLIKGLDLQKFNGRIRDIRRRFDSLLESIIKSREDVRRKKREEQVLNVGGDDNKARDFLDILLDEMEEDEGSEIKITRNNIKALVLDFMTAATDTSATSIEWSLAELINNPTVLKKAQEEIDRVVGRDRLVQETDLPNLPYIQAIIKETFRIHPPVPLVIRRSTNDCKVNGYEIPKHTLLFVNNWAMGRDPECWESPMDFRPERFLRPNNPEQVAFMEVRGQNFQMLPFGSGRRGCPGVNLALQVVFLVLAALLQCFEWNPRATSIEGINGSDRLDMNEQPGLTVPRAHNLVCVPVPRFDLSKIVG